MAIKSRKKFIRFNIVNEFTNGELTICPAIVDIDLISSVLPCLDPGYSRINLVNGRSYLVGSNQTEEFIKLIHEISGEVNQFYIDQLDNEDKGDLTGGELCQVRQREGD